jgi:hypothetical protein
MALQQFPVDVLENIFNTTLDFHLKGAAQSQVLQDRPLYNDLMASKEAFSGGKEYIDGPVKGEYSSEFQGFEGDDDVEFVNPANTKRWYAKWYLLHAGIKVTHDELLRNGISVTETTTGSEVSTLPKASVIQLTNIFEEKVDDLKEGSARSFAEMMWLDGTQDSKAIPGIQSFILTAPTSGTSFRLDRSNSWWRNRADITIASSTDPSDQVLVQKLQNEVRQLRRYSKKAKHKAYCGSDFLDLFEMELRAKGTYTMDGWAKSKSIDAGVADVAFKGIEFVYEPLLDDLLLPSYCYLLDMNAIKLRPISGEDMKQHTPARPPEKFVLYRSTTFAGALTASQLNTSGVYAAQ